MSEKTTTVYNELCNNGIDASNLTFIYFRRKWDVNYKTPLGRVKLPTQRLILENPDTENVKDVMKLSDFGIKSKKEVKFHSGFFYVGKDGFVTINPNKEEQCTENGLTGFEREKLIENLEKVGWKLKKY